MEDTERRCILGTDGKRSVNDALVVKALKRAQTHSPFLKFHLESGSPTAAALLDGRIDEALALARRAGEGLDPMTALRCERSAFALALAVGDLAGALTLEQVFADLSDLADRSIGRAISAAIAERYPDEEPRGFAALALGKLGGRELN